MHLFSRAVCYIILQDKASQIPISLTAGGPQGGQPPYRTAPLFAAETRPPHHHQTPEYNCQKKRNCNRIVSGKDDIIVAYLKLIKRVKSEVKFQT
jgi:hypothetical protein